MEKNLKSNSKIKFKFINEATRRVLILEKPLEIKNENIVYLEELLTLANGKADNGILRLEDILQFVKDCTKKLDDILLKKYQNDIELRLARVCRRDFPQAYKFCPKETKARFIVKKSKVYLESLCRSNTNWDRPCNIIFNNDEVKQIAMENLLSNFSIMFPYSIY